MTARGGSLHRRVGRTLLGLTLAGILGVTVLLWTSAAAQARSLEATRSFVQDERTSDRIVRAVLRQLAIAAAFPTASGEERREAFLSSGVIVHDELRRYLQGPLTSEERVRLAQVREAHQRFEVEAAQAAELFARGAEQEAQVELAAMAGLVDEFLDGLGDFFTIRLDALDQLQRTQEDLYVYLLAGGIALGLGLVGLSILAGWELSQRVAVPLAELASVTERIADGELDARVSNGGDDEFRALGDRFNRMTERLQQRERELTHALQEVEEAQTELIASEKLRAVGRMSAGFAHELNNPLTSVLGYAQLLAERYEEAEAPGRDEAAELLTPILKEASRARGLVRSFLQVARRPKGSLGPVPLVETVEVVVGLRAYAFQQAGLGLEIDQIPDVRVHADPDLLHGVFLNLINNALDAMRAGGHGTLTISGGPAPSEKAVELTFTDTGPGLSQPDRVFEPFFTTKPVGEGTGLGLSLVHQFVTSFGGTVRATNVRGAGARFILRLPLAESERGVEPVATERAATWKGENEVHPPAEGVRRESSPEQGADPRAFPDPAAATSAARTVLVVEDEPHLLRLQERLLSRLGVRVLLAGSAATAREMLSSEQVDAIVSDVKMPGETGVHLYEWIRETHPVLADRFLFVTGDAASPELGDIRDEVEDRIVMKPFRMDDYLARVRALMD